MYFLNLERSDHTNEKSFRVGEDIKLIDGIVSVHDLHIWTMSSNYISLSAHMIINDTTQWHTILMNTQKMLHDKYNINHITIQPELSF